MSGPYTNVDGEGGTYRISLTAVLPNVGSDPATWDTQALIEYLSITDYEYVSGVTSEIARWENPSGTRGRSISLPTGAATPCDRCGEATLIEDVCRFDRVRPPLGSFSSAFLCHECYRVRSIERAEYRGGVDVVRTCAECGAAGDDWSTYLVKCGDDPWAGRIERVACFPCYGMIHGNIRPSRYGMIHGKGEE